MFNILSSTFYTFESLFEYDMVKGQPSHLNKKKDGIVNGLILFFFFKFYLKNVFELKIASVKII